MGAACACCEEQSDSLRGFIETDAGGTTILELCDPCYEIRERQQYENDWFIN